MKFTAHDLMCMYDAMLHYTIRPEFRDCDVIAAYHLGILEKIEKELAEFGFSYNGYVEYDLNQR